MSGITYVLNSDERKVVDGLRKTSVAMKQTEAAAKSTGREMSRGLREAEREAQRFQRSQEDIGKSFKAVELRAHGSLGQMRDELRRSGVQGATAQRNIALLGRTAGKTGDMGQRAGRQMNHQIGQTGVLAAGASTAIGGLATRLSAFVSAGAGIAAIVKGLTDVKAAADAAGQRLQDRHRDRQDIMTIAQGDTHEDRMADFDRMIGLKDRAMASGMSEEDAYGLVFRLGSSSRHLLNEEGVDMLMDVRRAGIDPEQAVKATKIAQTAFGGDGTGTTGAGNEMQMANKLAVAAAHSDFTTSDLVSAAAGPMADVGQAGGNDEDVLALMGQFSKSVESAGEAATMVQAMATVINRKRHLIKGGDQMSFMDIVTNFDRLEEQGMLLDESGNAVSREAFLGRQEAMRGAALASIGRDEIYGRRAQISMAEYATDMGGGFVGDRQAIFAADPELTAAADARRAEMRLQQAQNQFAVPNQQASAVQAGIYAQSIEEDPGMLNRTRAAIDDMGMSMVRRLYGDEMFVDTFGGRGGDAPVKVEVVGGTADAERTLAEEVRRNTEAAEALTRQLEAAGKIPANANRVGATATRNAGIE